MRTAIAPDLDPVSRLFKALGDPTRLRIVALLAHGELCVCHLQHALALPQPHVSRHLGVLRAAGVVEARREGSWIHYSLSEQGDEASRRQMRALVRSFAGREALRRDVARSRAASGPGCGARR
jgi:ArsR family transcriptional regulator